MARIFTTSDSTAPFSSFAIKAKKAKLRPNRGLRVWLFMQGGVEPPHSEVLHQLAHDLVQRLAGRAAPRLVDRAERLVHDVQQADEALLLRTHVHQPGEHHSLGGR